MITYGKYSALIYMLYYILLKAQQSEQLPPVCWVLDQHPGCFWTGSEESGYYSLTWKDALKKCESSGGSLAKITQVTDSLVSRLSTFGTAWVGLSDGHTTGVFRWADTSLFKETFDWSPDSLTDACVIFDPAARRFFQRPCSNSNNYLCQKVQAIESTPFFCEELLSNNENVPLEAVHGRCLDPDTDVWEMENVCLNESSEAASGCHVIIDDVRDVDECQRLCSLRTDIFCRYAYFRETATSYCCLSKTALHTRSTGCHSGEDVELAVKDSVASALNRSPPCYTFDSYAELNFYQATEQCENQGYNLAQVHSSEEEAQLTAVMVRDFVWLWIGLARHYEGVWMWNETRTSLYGYTNWDNYIASYTDGPSHCSYISLDSLQWQSGPCSSRYFGVACEHSLMDHCRSIVGDVANATVNITTDGYNVTAAIQCYPDHLFLDGYDLLEVQCHCGDTPGDVRVPDELGNCTHYTIEECCDVAIAQALSYDPELIITIMTRTISVESLPYLNVTCWEGSVSWHTVINCSCDIVQLVSELSLVNCRSISECCEDAQSSDWNTVSLTMDDSMYLTATCALADTCFDHRTTSTSMPCTCNNTLIEDWVSGFSCIDQQTYCEDGILSRLANVTVSVSGWGGDTVLVSCIGQGYRFISTEVASVPCSCNMSFELLDQTLGPCYNLENALCETVISDETSGLCFWYNAAPLSYADALETCQEDGGTLAMVFNADIEAVLSAYMLDLYPYHDRTWIGLSDGHTKGVFRWTSSKAAFMWQNWDTNEPENGNCVLRSRAGLWSTDECNENRPFICMSTPSVPALACDLIAEGCLGFQDETWTNFTGSCIPDFAEHHAIPGVVTFGECMASCLKRTDFRCMVFEYNEQRLECSVASTWTGTLPCETSVFFSLHNRSPRNQSFWCFSTAGDLGIRDDLDLYESEDLCGSVGFSMLELYTEEEMIAISDLVHGTDYQLGLMETNFPSENGDTNIYRWRGWTYPEWAAWEPGHPEDDDDRDCVAVSNNQWQTVECDTTGLALVCQASKDHLCEVHANMPMPNATGVYDNVTKTVIFSCTDNHFFPNGSTSIAIPCFHCDVMHSLELIEQIPGCNYTDCGDPDTLDNTTLIMNSSVPGDIATYICDAGYAFSDNVTDVSRDIVCLLNGTWDTLVDSCQRIYCDDPEPVGVLKPVYWLNESVTGYAEYACPSGYDFIGDNRTACEEDGSWGDLNDTIYCAVAECQVPQNVSHSSGYVLLSGDVADIIQDPQIFPEVTTQANDATTQIAGGNIALGKSTFSADNSSYGTHDQGTDGCLASAHFLQCCVEVVGSWWLVDLEDFYWITQVGITNGNTGMVSYAASQDSLTIGIAAAVPTSELNLTNICMALSYALPESTTSLFICVQPVYGQYLSITTAGTHIFLCEVEVFEYLGDNPNETVNIAAGKDTILYNIDPTVDLATDGCLNCGCAYTNAGPGETSGWLAVDLESEYTIGSVKITNGNAVQDHSMAAWSGNYKVGILETLPGVVDPITLVDNDLCTHYIGYIPEEETVTLYCDRPVIGRYLVLQKHIMNQLIVCEVQVFEYIPEQSTTEAPEGSTAQPMTTQSFSAFNADTACDTGWNPETGTCYWINYGHYTSDEATEACMDNGGYVASMKTWATKDFLTNHRMIEDRRLWISLTVSFDNSWVWGDSQSVTWNNWADGHPYNANKQCAIVNTFGLWKEAYCLTEVHDVLCEKGWVSLESYNSSYSHGDQVQYRCEEGYWFEHGIWNRTINCTNGLWNETLLVGCTPLDCGQPPAFATSYLHLVDTTFGNNATYYCLLGYYSHRIENDMILGYNSTCNATGLWSELSDLCKPVNCSTPHTFTHSGPLALLHMGVENSLVTYGAVVEYQCYDGYHVINGSVQQRTFISECTLQGEWNVTEDPCQQIQCDVPTQFLSSNVYYNDRLYTSNATYHCVEGYFVSRTSTAIILHYNSTCSESGRWTEEHDLCQRVQCSYPATFDRSAPSIEHTNFFYGSEITYTCLTGYSYLGLQQFTSVCNASGDWSVESEQCIDMVCAAPPVPQCAHIVMEYIVEGVPRVLYECDNGAYFDGYNLINQISASCLSIEEWEYVPDCSGCNSNERQMFSSVEICPPVAEISNAEIVDIYNMIDGYVSYTCGGGHVFPAGGQTRIAMCQYGGVWSEHVEPCTVVTCPEVPQISNAAASTMARTVNTRVVYTCDDGLLFPNGLETLEIICTQSGQWSTIPGTCAYRCVPLPMIRQAYVQESVTNTIGSSATFACDTGYRFIHGNHNKTIFCLRNGDWEELGDCAVEVCPLLVAPEHGALSTNIARFGTNVTVSCEPGYNLLPGQQYIHIYCTDRREWNQDIGWTCSPVLCPAIPHAMNADRQGNGRGYLHNITYSCHDGLQIRDPYRHIDGQREKTITCQQNETWSFTDIACELGRCPPLEWVENATPDHTNATQGSRVIFTCHPGYHFQSIHTETLIVVCDDLTWNQTDEDCSPKDCGEITVERSRVNSSDTVYLSRVNVICDAGYEMYGERENIAECGENGRWRVIGSQQDSVGECLPLSCAAPPSVINARLLDYSSTLFQSAVSYECRHGYWFQRGITVKNAACSDTGHWEPDSLRCIEIECPALRVWEGMILSTSLKTLGTTVNVTCDNDRRFAAANNEYVITTCMITGEWSPTPPNCRAKSLDYTISSTEATGAAAIGAFAVAVLAVVFLGVIVTDSQAIFDSLCLMIKNMKYIKQDVFSRTKKEQATST